MSEITAAEKDALIHAALGETGRSIVESWRTTAGIIFDAGVKHGMERERDDAERGRFAGERK